MPQTATPKEVAEWMNAEFERQNGYLDQADAAHAIFKRFGQEHIYENENGNWAISKKVLGEFRKLTEHTAVWSSGGKCWERRTRYHEDGKRQAD